MPLFASTISTPTKRSSHILALPYEVRAMIWDYALMSPSCGPQTVTPKSHSWGSSPVTTSDPHDILVTVDEESMAASDVQYWGKEPMTRLLRVSKLVSAEAKAVLYSKFDFTFGYSTNETYVEAKCFLAIIGRDAQASIRSITVAVSVNVYAEDNGINPLAQHDARASSLFRASLPALSQVTFIFKDLSPIDHQVQNLYDGKRPDYVAKLTTIKYLLDACRPLMLVQKRIVRFRPRSAVLENCSDGVANDYMRRSIESGSW